MSALKSEISGLFENLIVALMMPPISYDAAQLHKAIKVSNEDFLQLCRTLYLYIYSSQERVQRFND